MSRCPRRCRSPLGQAARSLYQLVTGSLSPGMRTGGGGWAPQKVSQVGQELYRGGEGKAPHRWRELDPSKKGVGVKGQNP